MKWTAIVLLGLPVLIYLVWLTGNLKHDALSPEVTELLARRPAQMNEKDNAYFDIIGLGAPDNQNPHEWGASWFVQASTNDSAYLAGKSVTPIKLEGYPASSQRAKLPCSNKDSKHACLEEVMSDRVAAKKYLDAEAILLRRFDALLDQDYQEPYHPVMSDFPPFAPELRAVTLARIRIALEIAEGKDSAAIAQWGRETAFLLRQAEHSHSVVDKMICIAALNHHQELLAEYLSTHPQAARAQTKQLLPMLNLYIQSAVTLKPAFESEAAFFARLLVNSNESIGILTEGGEFGKKVANILSDPFLDRQATVNEAVKNLLEWSHIAELGGDAYRTALAKMAAQTPDIIDATFSYHNPVGKILIQVGNNDFSKYLYKSDNIIANKKLLAFTLGLIARQATSSEQIAQALAAQSAELQHPFTGEAPAWNAKQRTLGYSTPAQFKESNAKPVVIKL